MYNNLEKRVERIITGTSPKVCMCDCSSGGGDFGCQCGYVDSTFEQSKACMGKLKAIQHDMHSSKTKDHRRRIKTEDKPKVVAAI